MRSSAGRRPAPELTFISDCIWHLSDSSERLNVAPNRHPVVELSGLRADIRYTSGDDLYAVFDTHTSPAGS